MHVNPGTLPDLLCDLKKVAAHPTSHLVPTAPITKGWDWLLSKAPSGSLWVLLGPSGGPPALAMHGADYQTFKPSVPPHSLPPALGWKR